MRQPFPSRINSGGPDTDLNARTGELTPPGKYFLASSNRAADVLRLMRLVNSIVITYDSLTIDASAKVKY